MYELGHATARCWLRAMNEPSRHALIQGCNENGAANQAFCSMMSLWKPTFISCSDSGWLRSSASIGNALTGGDDALAPYSSSAASVFVVCVETLRSEAD